MAFALVSFASGSIVEDDGETRRLLVRLLRENGYRAIGVADGDAMWQAMGAARPDLLLLDLMLPRRPGLMLLRELRGQERWAGLPVVVVTARGQAVDRTRGLELGADDQRAQAVRPPRATGADCRCAAPQPHCSAGQPPRGHPLLRLGAR